MKWTQTTVLVLLTTALVAPAAGQSPGGRTRPPDEIRVIGMTVRPAAEPGPALRYRLLPSVLDQQPGNAADLYSPILEQMKARPESRKTVDRIVEWLELPLDELPVDI